MQHYARVAICRQGELTTHNCFYMLEQRHEKNLTTFNLLHIMPSAFLSGCIPRYGNYG